MAERIVLAVTLLLLIFLARYGIHRWQRWTQRRRWDAAATTALQALGLGDGPVILTFSTPECAQCHLMQEPALNELLRLEPGVQVRHIDAVERVDLASAFGVLTVPTTVVLDARHRPVATNNGYTPAARLRQQVGGASRTEGSVTGSKEPMVLRYQEAPNLSSKGETSQ